MVIQGYPIASLPNLVEKTPEPVMAGIGGNMMASPVVLAILQALFAALPWNPTSGAVRTDTCDVDAAMTAFHNCVTPEAQEHTRGISRDPGQQKRRRMETTQNLNLT